MDQMVTQSRLLDPVTGYQPTYYQKNHNGTVQFTVPWAQSVLNTMVASQVTTSHRTGYFARFIEGKSSPDEILTEARSAIDFVRRAVDEKRREGSGFDTGHPFSTQKKLVEMSHPYVDTGTVTSGSQRWQFKGSLIVPDNPSSALPKWPSIPSFSQSEINYFGSKFIENSIPTRSTAELATTLLELVKDGFPKLDSVRRIPNTVGPPPKKFLSKADEARGRISDAWLEWNFAFKPLGNDLGSLMAAVVDIQSTIDQYRRDSGKVVRRRRTLPTAIVSTQQNLTSHVNTWVDQPVWLISCMPTVDGGKKSIVETSETVLKFSGAYSYYLPSGNSILDKLEEFVALADKTLGAADLSTLWELAPWSWLTDWMSNAGTVVSNIEAFSKDSLVMRYGYLMRQVTAKRTYSHTGFKLGLSPSAKSTGPIVNTYTIISKERWRATPYGFGLDPSNFTSRQWSILGAIGQSYFGQK